MFFFIMEFFIFQLSFFVILLHTSGLSIGYLQLLQFHRDVDKIYRI